MIYSSGRESYFNLNSTWYDPSGSWLDTRRTPFRYGYTNCCSSGCSEGAQGMCGHDYRHYSYRQPRCSERCTGASSSSCHGAGCGVRRPSYGYGGSGGCQGYGGSVCAERCHGGGSGCVRRPSYSYGTSGGCQGYGGSVCAERCHGSGVRVQVCPPPVQVCPRPCPPPVQQSCVPLTKAIPRPQQQQICQVPARKIK
ncbi:uncharacterized protein FYW23_014224 [Sylvia borin]